VHTLVLETNDPVVEALAIQRLKELAPLSSLAGLPHPSPNVRFLMLYVKRLSLSHSFYQTHIMSWASPIDCVESRISEWLCASVYNTASEGAFVPLLPSGAAVQQATTAVESCTNNPPVTLVKERQRLTKASEADDHTKHTCCGRLALPHTSYSSPLHK
jgi:hypothetical protein